MLEDLSGERVNGYRAASYSICPDNLWALNLLADAGYTYSSSIVPMPRARMRYPMAPLRVQRGRRAPRRNPDHDHRARRPQHQLRRRRLVPPVPVRVLALGHQSSKRKEAAASIFISTLWEVDPEQPRVPSASRRARSRLLPEPEAMHDRRRLLHDFRWGRVDEVFMGARL